MFWNGLDIRGYENSRKLKAWIFLWIWGVRIWSSNPGPDLNMLWLALPKTLPIVCFSLVTLARLL
ncbi:MAG: hypothetical protein DME81_07165 [Verrucomicrobia bacterium]|nr:MAG: hypothetical protein DME81_07165 [Verrucomicrobiota bacterium]